MFDKIKVINCITVIFRLYVIIVIMYRVFYCDLKIEYSVIFNSIKPKI